MLKKTALHPEHQKLNARLVDFAGWEMPIQYQSQLDEHHAVRLSAGMFDVAHMSALDLHGAGATDFLRKLLANDVARLSAEGVPAGKALYSCMLRDDGGIIDDLIVYRLSADWYRMVVNAGTTDKDLAWIKQHASAFEVEVKHRTDLGILAVQGPQARQMVARHLPSPLSTDVMNLTVFQATHQADWFVGRTGYTGEDGFELILPHAELVGLWQKLLADGVKPCGLGARDTLRLEAGMNLYGQDMDESKQPLESGLGWTIAWGEPQSGERHARDGVAGQSGEAGSRSQTAQPRDFIGRSAIEPLRGKSKQKLIALVLEGRGVLRAHMKLRFANGAVGETTSGGFSPTMKSSIAFARVGADASGDCEVEIRGQWLPARLVKPPFVRNGKVLV